METALKGTHRVRSFLNQARMLIVLVVLLGIFSALSPYFLNVRNIFAIGLTISVIGIVCIGQSLILLTGAFDLSVGGIAGLSGMIVAILTKQYGNYWAWFFLGLAAGTAIGLLNGLFITKLKINALITTLSMMTILSGVVFLVSGGFAIGVNLPSFRFLGTTRVIGIPLPIIILVLLYAVAYVILRSSVFGRYVYSIGGNAEAARLSGINVDRMRILVYTLSGLLSGLGRHRPGLAAGFGAGGRGLPVPHQLDRGLRPGRHLDCRRRRQHLGSPDRRGHRRRPAVGADHGGHALVHPVDRDGPHPAGRRLSRPAAEELRVD